MKKTIFSFIQNLKMATFLSFKYLNNTKNNFALRSMILVCILSISIGTCTLAIATSIMRGFEIEIQKKLQGISPDIIIESPNGSTLENKSLEDYLYKNYSQEIIGITASSNQHAILQKESNPDISLIVLLKGVDPSTQNKVIPLEEKITYKNEIPSQELSKILINHNIIIGNEIAKELQILLGDKIILYYNQNPHETFDHTHLNSTTCTVIGLLNTGIAEYDSNFIIANNELITELLEQTFITQVGIKLNPLLSEKNKKDFLKKIKQLSKLSISTWEEQYPAIISALKLEKFTMYFLLLLFIIITSINNISLFFMFITYKQIDIMLLLSHNVNLYTIMSIFLLCNTLIATCASILGITCSIMISFLLKNYCHFTLPEIYYVNHIPIEIDIFTFIIIIIGTVGISSITALIPIFSIKKLSLSQLLKIE